MQSLVNQNEVKDLVRNYGMVIVDECHHVSAYSFEQVLKTVNAKYVYGLTATPTRKDGRHPIIFMHCGNIRYRVNAKQQAAERPFEHFIIPRFTRFRKPAHQDESKWQDICSHIQNDSLRNDLITNDVVAAVKAGRTPLILTERTKHVALLSEELGKQVKNVITLSGSLPEKHNAAELQRAISIAVSEPLVIVATGRYVGEGFDMPRLDTLFLAMPVSWKGTVQQYAGRLHRLFDGKDEVLVYDYVDVHVPMLERMYQERLKAYASIGYKAKGNAQPTAETHSIFDSHTFLPVYTGDIQVAKSEIVIVSPFLTKQRILSSMPYLTFAVGKITVVTKPPSNYNEADRKKIEECISLLTSSNIKVKTKDRIHQKFAVLDQHIVWYGSINLLSYGKSEESIMRIDNADIAGELLGSIESSGR
jgi:superfamily II DNA or RNA helicase